MSDSFQVDVLRNAENNNWLIISFILIGVGYLGVRLVYSRYWRRYRQALFFGLEAGKLMQEKNVLLMQAAFSLNSLAILNISLFTYMFFDHFEIFEDLPATFPGWGLIVIILIVAIAGKFMFNNLLGIIGDNRKASEYLNHQWLINLKNLGFYLLPLNIIAAFISPDFADYAYFAGLALLIFTLIMNYIKGFSILFQHRISIYYGILYLCTLEILPVLIIWKVIRL